MEDALISVDNLKLNPELTKLDKLYASVSELEALNQKDGKPVLGFGLDYINVEQRSNLNFSDNGKDIIMPMINVSIPIFNKSYRSKTLQNKIKQQEIEVQKTDRLNQLNTLLEQAIRAQKASKIAYVTQTKNIGQAKNAEDILIKNYETGTIDFNDVLDIQELQLKFQINRIKSIQNYFIQGAKINYLIQ